MAVDEVGAQEKNVGTLGGEAALASVWMVRVADLAGAVMEEVMRCDIATPS